MSERNVAIVAFGIAHCKRGVEANAQMLFDKLGTVPSIHSYLIKGSGEKTAREVVLSVPKRDSLLCRFLGKLRGYNIYWEQVFFMLRLGVHLLGKGRRYDAIYTQEYVHLVGMGKLKKWFGLSFDLVYCEGFVISRPTRLKYADVLQEINRKNYDELKVSAQEQGVDMQLLPHFYEAEEGQLTAEEKKSIEGAKVFKGNRRMLFFVGSTERPEKNFDYILQEFPKLTEDYCLLICGEVSPKTLTFLQGKFPGRVHHLYVRHMVMQEIYPLADFFLLPALDEPFGISIIEAMYFARPLILHDTPHSRWVSGDATQCIDMHVENSLVNHLRAIDDVGAYISEKGIANKTFFDGHYTWSVLKEDYLRLFNS